MGAWVVIEARGAESDYRASEAAFAMVPNPTCDEINAHSREQATEGDKRTSRILMIGSAMPYVGGTLVALSLLVLIPVRKQGQG